METQKRFVVIIMAIVAVIGFLGTSEIADCAEKKIVIKAAHANPPSPDHNFTRGLLFFGERLNQLTGGKTELKLHQQSLGGEREIFEGLQMGTIEAGAVTTGTMSSVVKEVGITSMPFIFSGFPHAYRVLDGPLGDKLKAAAAEKGILIFGWWPLAAKCPYSNVPIKQMTDFKGVKIRCIESPEFVSLYKAYGAIAVPMAFPEVYGALQQGVVDGVDCEYIGCWGAKMNEVTKYITELNHVLMIGTISVSKKWFSGLPVEIQTAVRQAAVETQAPVREYGARAIEDTKKKWMNSGIKIYEPKGKELEPFVKAAKSVYPQFYERVGKENIEWVEKVGMEMDYLKFFEVKAN